MYPDLIGLKHTHTRTVTDTRTRTRRGKLEAWNTCKLGEPAFVYLFHSCASLNGARCRSGYNFWTGSRAKICTRDRDMRRFFIIIIIFFLSHKPLSQLCLYVQFVIVCLVAHLKLALLHRNAAEKNREILCFVFFFAPILNFSTRIQSQPQWQGNWGCATYGASP